LQHCLYLRIIASKCFVSYCMEGFGTFFVTLLPFLRSCHDRVKPRTCLLFPASFDAANWVLGQPWTSPSESTKFKPPLPITLQWGGEKWYTYVKLMCCLSHKSLHCVTHAVSVNSRVNFEFTTQECGNAVFRTGHELASGVVFQHLPQISPNICLTWCFDSKGILPGHLPSLWFHSSGRTGLCRCLCVLPFASSPPTDFS
jgi:hypothetical protein